MSFKAIRISPFSTHISNQKLKKKCIEKENENALQDSKILRKKMLGHKRYSLCQSELIRDQCFRVFQKDSSDLYSNHKEVLLQKKNSRSISKNQSRIEHDDICNIQNPIYKNLQTQINSQSLESNSDETSIQNDLISNSQSNSPEPSSKETDHHNILFRMHNFLYKLFMNIPFTSRDVDLNPTERKIVSEVYKKKKFAGYSRITFTPEFFNRGRQSLFKKKTEDGLKFVFKKAIRHMKLVFKEEFLEKNNLSKITTDQLDFEFYSHHYGKIAEENDMHLERFYHFRNWKKRDSPYIPKSITKAYVSNLKRNPNFVGQIRDYLNNHLMESFKGFNSKKIRAMIMKWERTIERQGTVEGLKAIGKMIRSTGNKLPWTVNEVNRALEDTLSYLGN